MATDRTGRDADITPIPPGGEPAPPGDHWDTTNPRDMATIRRAQRTWPRRFASMDAAKQDRLVRVVDLAAQQAERVLTDADAEPERADRAAELALDAAKTGAVLVRIQQADDHHAETISAARDGAGIALTLVAIPPPVVQRIESDD